MSSIQLSNIVKRYGSTQVVHGIDLEVKEGEFIVLLGPSGCGKSTTLRMVAGLEDVSSGTLTIAGNVVNDVPPKDRGVAMVFQNYALYPHMTVRGNIEFALKPLKLDSSEVACRIDEAASILELTPLLDRKPAQLSGGQRQRVAMGRAMVRTPDIFLFDEPLSNLDAKLRTQVRWEIAKLHKRLDSTILYVTHDQIEAMTLADRIVIMRDGYIEQVGTPLEVFTKPCNIFVATFIGSPAMNIIPATVREGALTFGTMSLPIPARLLGMIAEGKSVSVGIRPSDIIVSGDMHEGAVEAVVEVSEFMGKEEILDLRFGDQEIIAEIPVAAHLAENTTVFVRFNPDALHVFDADTGVAL